MLLLVAGTLAEGGSLLQKILFLIGAPALGITAYVDKQKMFTVLQAVATLGAVLAFFPSVSEAARYCLMGAVAIVGLAYLVRRGYFSSDRWGWLGSAGLILIAMGFATDPVSSPLLFGIFLGVGGLAVAAYSAISFFHYKVRIAVMWLVLNVIFSINPILIFIKSI